MRKLLLISLCVPLIFSCGGDKKSNDDEVEILKNSQKYIDTASVIFSKIYNDKNFENLDVGLLDTSIFQNQYDHSRPLRLILGSSYLVNRGSNDRPLMYFEREPYNGYMFDFYDGGHPHQHKISQNFLVIDGRIVVWEGYDKNGKLNFRLHPKDGNFVSVQNQLPKKMHPPSVKKEQEIVEPPIEVEEIKKESTRQEVIEEEKPEINKKAIFNPNKKKDGEGNTEGNGNMGGEEGDPNSEHYTGRGFGDGISTIETYRSKPKDFDYPLEMGNGYVTVNVIVNADGQIIDIDDSSFHSTFRYIVKTKKENLYKAIKRDLKYGPSTGNDKSYKIARLKIIFDH